MRNRFRRGALSLCPRTMALTGPPPINIDFRNDAIGGSASNALFCRLFRRFERDDYRIFAKQPQVWSAKWFLAVIQYNELSFEL